MLLLAAAHDLLHTDWLALLLLLLGGAEAWEWRALLAARGEDQLQQEQCACLKDLEGKFCHTHSKSHQQTMRFNLHGIWIICL